MNIETSSSVASKNVSDLDHEKGVDLQDKVITLDDVTPKFEKMWWRYPFLLKLNFLLLGSILAQVASGYDGSMMNSLQTLPSFVESFNNPHGAILGTMSNGIAIGTLISIPFTMFVTDFFGRRWTIIVGCVIIILGSGLQGGANTIGMFTGARIVIGVGSCLASAAASPLLAETAYPSQRATVTALLVASWPMGSFLAALVTWGPYHSSMRFNAWSWRLPSILQAAIPLVQMIIVFVGPESPRWLISNGKHEEARAIFVKYHGNGDEDSELVKYEMAEITAVIEAEKIQRKSRWADWFSSKARLHRLFIVLAVPAMNQLCGNALISYYLHIILNNIGITNPNSQLKLNIGITVYGLVWALCIGTIAGRFPRKVMFITGYGTMCLSYVIWTILSALNQQQDFKNKALGRGVVAMIFLFQGFYHIESPIAMTYVMEVCPFHLRGQGSTMYQLAGGVTGLFNNYVNNIAMDAIQWKYYIVWCVWLVVQMNIVYWFFPETHGLGLEEVAMVFGDEATVGYVAGESALRSSNHSMKGGEVTHVEVSASQEKAVRT